MTRPAVFEMIRPFDETGISGTGKVAEGLVTSAGKVVLAWCVKDKPNSVVIFDHFSDFWDIHVKPHPLNKTEFNWVFGDGLP